MPSPGCRKIVSTNPAIVSNVRTMASDAQLTPMMAQYRRIKTELPSDALLLFRLGAGASAASSATMTISGRILPKNPIAVNFGTDELRPSGTRVRIGSPGHAVGHRKMFPNDGSVISVGRSSVHSDG